ncbi:hypothetical protein HID58_067665 [Brassica napus]|uniref:F-box associated beta-propeller type 1 domain-containing protein n=1 Tax=Brassica napus TaxID=3708 RepID=A0ABQ7ZJB8_BRANA|nr:hypothetical protein HID58_067665 [Brassica napus]
MYAGGSNPYLGQVRWIKLSKSFSMFNNYCMGYDIKSNHKVLRLLYSGSTHYREGLSLKGNTYFFAQRVKEEDRSDGRIFNIERFRHCLDLQSNSRNGDSVILSSVREEQLALLFYSVDTYEIEIQITTKIEANELTWINFLKVDLKPFTGMLWNFFVDEKKKVALIWDKHYPKAYLIGEGNYFKVAALGNSIYYWAVVCSYVPSSVPIQKGSVLEYNLELDFLHCFYRKDNIVPFLRK